MKEVREVKQADRKRHTQAEGGGDRVMERDFFNGSLFYIYIENDKNREPKQRRVGDKIRRKLKKQK